MQQLFSLCYKVVAQLQRIMRWNFLNLGLVEFVLEISKCEFKVVSSRCFLVCYFDLSSRQPNTIWYYETATEFFIFQIEIDENHFQTVEKFYFKLGQQVRYKYSNQQVIDIHLSCVFRPVGSKIVALFGIFLLEFLISYKRFFMAWTVYCGIIRLFSVCVASILCSVVDFFPHSISFNVVSCYNFLNLNLLLRRVGGSYRSKATFRDKFIRLNFYHQKKGFNSSSTPTRSRSINLKDKCELIWLSWV